MPALHRNSNGDGADPRTTIAPIIVRWYLGDRLFTEHYFYLNHFRDDREPNSVQS